MKRRVPDTVELRIPSQLRYLGMVDSVIQSFAAELDWDADDVNNLSTSAIEAASNAMEHGNAFAAGKTVLLRIRSAGRDVEIEVEDEGEGFDAAPFQRELTPEDLLKLRGRGIFIMRSFTNEVRFSRLPQRGMRVYLRKSGKSAAARTGNQDVAGSS